MEINHGTKTKTDYFWNQDNYLPLQLKIRSNLFPMKRLTLLAIIFSICACTTEPKANQEAETTLATPAATPPAATSPTNGRPEKLDATLTLSAISKAMKKGETSCVDITCTGFIELVSMQYSMHWDKNILKFKEVKSFGLPYLGPDSFGAHRSAEGELTSVWIDNSLKGVTREDGSILFQVCFEAVGNTGQASIFRFLDRPTAIEAVHKSVKEVNFQGLEGVIKVQ